MPRCTAQSRWRPAGIAAGLAVLLITSSAHAYRTASALPTIPDDAVVKWTRPVVLYLHEEQPENLDRDEVLAAFERAMQVWAEPPCANIEWAAVETTSSAARAGDQKNVIQWITGDWIESGLDPLAPATTEVQYEKVDGVWRIDEIDIRLNADLFDYTVAPSSNSSQPSLEVVALHELGHALGMLHPCESEGFSAPPCGGFVGPKAVMHPEYEFTELSLQPDDIDGICSLYPASHNTNKCDAGKCEVVDADASIAEADPENDASVGTGMRDFGQSCSDASDCHSGTCVDGFSAWPTCSRLCSTDDLSDEACPSGWECASVGQDRVCVPRETGCSVTRSRPLHSSAIPLTIIVLCAIRIRRSKR